MSAELPAGLGRFDYEYWADGRLKKVSRPGGVAEEFEYDALGRTTRRKRGSQAWTTVWTEGAGETLSPTGDRTTVLPDGRGRTARRSFQPGLQSVSGLAQVEQSFDARDQLLRAVELTGSSSIETVFGYDERWRLESIVRGTESIGYAYAGSDELASVTTAAGQTGYSYGSNGLLASMSGPVGTVGFEWEPGGARLASVNGGGIWERTCYDGAGRVASVVAAEVPTECTGTIPAGAKSGFVYGYDGRGNRVAEEAHADGLAETRAYGYDAADRLLGLRNGDGSASLYELRGDGTRTAEKRIPGYWGALDDFASAAGAAEHLVYAYDAQDGLERVEDLLDPTKMRLYATDASGRVRSETAGGIERRFDWDAAGRLVALTETEAGSARTTRYGYDWANLRRWKEGSTGERTTYLWGAGELLEERIGAGPALRYQRGAGQVVGIGTERILHDGLGSAVGRFDTQTRTSTHYGFDAWGGLLGGTGPVAGDPSLAFAGQHWDADAGLSYAQQRWYDPRLGRFLSEDPLFGDVASPNSLMAWGYANGNPLGYTDPTGEYAFFGDSVRRLKADTTAGNVGLGAAEAGVNTVDMLLTVSVMPYLPYFAMSDTVDYVKSMGTARYWKRHAGTVLLGPFGQEVSNFWGISEALSKPEINPREATREVTQGAISVGLIALGARASGKARPAPARIPSRGSVDYAASMGENGGLFDYEAISLTKVRQQMAETAARQAADRAQTMSPRPRMAGALVVEEPRPPGQTPYFPEGGVRPPQPSMTLTGVNVVGQKTPPRYHPRVEKAYSEVPEAARSDSHLYCVECGLASRAAAAGCDMSTGVSAAAQVRAPGNPGHGVIRGPCSSCAPAMQSLEVSCVPGGNPR